ncbi:MAG: universal stress protein [Flavobacteriales bacterium]|nr:universal stress protein [Flavobacteriales bacterium]
MKTIVCPTDFSEIANNALEYACYLAKSLNAEIIVAHAQHVPIIDPAAPVNAMSAMLEEALEQANEKLTNLAGRYTLMTGVAIKTQASVGLLVDVIHQMHQEKSVDMIVMGTKGATNAVSKWIGTTAASIIQRCQLPVLIIPENSDFELWNKVAFATDFSQEDEATLGLFEDFMGHFKTEVHMVHVSKSKVNSEEMLRVIKHYEGKAIVENVVGADVVEELNRYVGNNDIGVLGMKRHHRGFFDSLFHKSITKEMAMTTKTPILIF